MKIGSQVIGLWRLRKMTHRIEEFDSGYNVIEVKTTGEECVLKEFTEKEEAKKFRKFLNLGGGFDNWTPNFFLVKTPIN